MYTRELRYKFYLAEQAAEQAKLERFINECVLIGESTNTFGNIDIIHESFVDKLKSAIGRFLQAISNMWHKFVEASDSLLKTNKAYLEKYKDIILKKKPVDADYSMYKYEQGLPLLLRTDIPVINLNSMDQDLVDDETFMRKHFSSLVQGAKTPYKISEIAKAKFRGGNGEEVTVNSSRLNMTDIYDYCYTYKKLQDLIEKDIKNIQKVTSDIIVKIDNMARRGEIKNESVIDLYGNRQYMSAVYESFVHEATPGQRVVKDTNQGSENKDNGNKDNEANKPHNNYNSMQKEGPNQEINTEKSAKELSEKANRYLKICGEVLAAKQSVAEEIYKAYMSIIKAHVRDYVGKTDDKADNRVKQAPSQQTTDNNKKEEPKDPAMSKSGSSFVKDFFERGKNALKNNK